jgi:hypothetical protein
MPGRTGIWMLDEARRLGLLEHTMTLIVTAHPEASELRGLEVVHKPLDLDRLMDQVSQLVVSSRE